MRDEIYKSAIEEAKKLMYNQTSINKAPSWLLTCLAVEVGESLADEFNVDSNIVMLTLYLQHLVFDPITKGEVQKHHPDLSADYVINNQLLEKWNIPLEDRKVIIEAIRSQHKKEVNPDLTIEVIKNAECQKFVTVKGALIWLHELGLRGINFDEAKELVLYKMEQKKSLLTLDKCVEDGNQNCKIITNMFDDVTILPKLMKLHQYGLEKVPFEEAIKLSELESMEKVIS